MANIQSVLKSEISRLARKEVRAETSTTRKQAAQHRRDIAGLKRLVSALQRRAAFLEKQEKRRIAQPKPVSQSDDRQMRFSPKWLKRHREKLGISAADYAKLIGVSSLSIYHWEAGKTKPRPAQVAKLAEVRGLGKREVTARLAE